MTDKEISQFFECLGEIWRDILTIEFLMRCAIAKKDGDINKLPKPPYSKGALFTEYPVSFSHYSLEILTEKFNKRYPAIQIPKELIELRNGMAHGLISIINNKKINELIKFKELKNKKGLEIEFYLPLELKRLKEIRKSLINVRLNLMQIAKD